MQPSLRPGASRTNRIVVGRERTIAFMGEEARTYATPSMILDIEHTCRELILEHASAGEDSVGMEVAVKHLAPTLMGMTVEIAARITSVEGRKVSFEVTVKDELDTVGTGSHMRFVVEKAKTLEASVANVFERRFIGSSNNSDPKCKREQLVEELSTIAHENLDEKEVVAFQEAVAKGIRPKPDDQETKTEKTAPDCCSPKSAVQS